MKLTIIQQRIGLKIYETLAQPVLYTTVRHGQSDYQIHHAYKQ